MKQSPRQRPIRDERDEQIEVQSRARSLEYVLSATTILTVICLLKGNPAWKGTISLAFFEAAFEILVAAGLFCRKIDGLFCRP